MGVTGKALAIGGLAAVLTLGATGVVVAAGTQGSGPASVLSSLVGDGTLTQEQADKVEAALKANRQEHRAAKQARRAEAEKVITSVLGITQAQLESARESGKTLNEIAGDKAPQLKAALVAHLKQETAKAVTDGKLTQEQADKLNARASQMVERMMSHDGPGGMRGREPGGPGRGDGQDGAMFDGDGPPPADGGQAL